MSQPFHHSVNLPAPLADVFRLAWDKFVDLADASFAEKIQQLTANPELLAQLAEVWSSSEFVVKECQRAPALLFDLLESGSLETDYADEDMRQKLCWLLSEVASEEALLPALRRLRNREMVRVIWRDRLGLATLEQTTRDLSLLAEACIDETLAWVYREACAKYGTPCSSDADDASPQQLVVLGMGKLGAWELNMSSDIDLIFAFPDKGETDSGLDNQQFFTRLAQRLIHCLDTRTADGFVFRVDMRLRPYGQSGALVLNFAAMSEYYQTQGRDWERYAFIKARVVAGDQDAGARLMEELRPFVYRRYLDYSAIEALRAMKGLIRREERRRGLQEDIKLGSGGIREVEFIVQVFQLVRGGRDRRLQESRLLVVIQTIVELGLLPEQVAVELVAAYRFLRNTEHAIQSIRDEQTQKLPREELDRLRLAIAMGFADWDGFASALTGHRDFVHEQFNELIAAPEEGDAAANVAAQDPWQRLWGQELDDEEAEALLVHHGVDRPAEVLAQLADFRASRKVQAMQPIALQRLDEFMPLMLSGLVAGKSPGETFRRIMLLVESVLRRTAYFVLLVENPPALNQLLALCAASPWIAEEVARYPLLLDELIDARELYSPADPHELWSELRQQILRIASDDVEQQMECLRQFKLAHVLRVAASEVTGVLSLMKVSDYLTFIAEAVLKEALTIAWAHVTEQYGLPGQACGRQSSDVAPEQNFIVVGYGKLGGLELSYSSDLDLVFVYDAPAQGVTDGEKSIENPVFYTRIAQRIIHMLTAYTPSGQLYDVDMRLRPSGNAGLLVSSLDAMGKYQREHAWLWEHQALVRARVVAGTGKLGNAFDELRKNILARDRDEAEVKRAVIEMRDKIRQAHGSAPGPDQHNPAFDLKYDAGGIVDIEFLVQYAVLAWSQGHPELVEYTDNVRILDALEHTGLMTADQAQKMRDAYVALRSVVHRLTIDGQSSRINLATLEDDEIIVHRAAVIAVWQDVLGQI